MKLSRPEIEECVRYIYAALIQERHINLSQDVIEELTNSYYEQSKVSNPLGQDEQGILTLTRPKSSALFADRVWSVGSPPEDKSITFGWEIPRDIRWRAMFDLAFLQAKHDGTTQEIENAPPATPNFLAYLKEQSREMAADYFKHGLNVVPLYDSSEVRNAEYKSGDQGVIVAIAEGVMVADEDSLIWEQVREFKRDTTSCTNYRRFIHWLDKEMNGKSTAFVIDEISSRLEGYTWALRKHGIKSVIGILEKTIKPSMLASVTAVGASLQYIMNQPVYSLLASGGLLLGGVALSLSKATLARKDIAMSHREINYMHQIKSKFKVGQSC